MCVCLYLTLLLLNCLFLFFIHLKLELLTQFPASNDENIFIFMKDRHLQYCRIGLTRHLPKNILLNVVIFLLLTVFIWGCCVYIYYIHRDSSISHIFISITNIVCLKWLYIYWLIYDSRRLFVMEWLMFSIFLSIAMFYSSNLGVYFLTLMLTICAGRTYIQEGTELCVRIKYTMNEYKISLLSITMYHLSNLDACLLIFLIIICGWH